MGEDTNARSEEFKELERNSLKLLTIAIWPQSQIEIFKFGFVYRDYEV